MFLMPFRLVAC